MAPLDDLTSACNSCHEATRFGFNVVKRPTGSSWFSNQDFNLPPQYGRHRQMMRSVGLVVVCPQTRIDHGLDHPAVVGSTATAAARLTTTLEA